MLWTDKARKYLFKYWNIESLKEKQVEAINNLLLGNDVIALLPTGYGKSMCYLLPPLLTRKVMFIISPLISLMDDQKAKLSDMKIKCSALHCNNKYKEQEIFDIMDGRINIVYMSPEFLVSNGLDLVSSLVEQDRMGFLAVDEAHCISTWGHDFRPEYKQIKKFREQYPDIPIIALTATATEKVCEDIATNINMTKAKIVRGNFDRENLHISVRFMPKELLLRGKKMVEKTVPREQVIKPLLDNYEDHKIIIYVGTRNDTEELASKLEGAIAYHAGMSKKVREQAQTDFASGTKKIIVSTIAFGMGIDQTVRCVIIFGCPSSIEEYYQQIGRGGRDNLPCQTIFYFDYGQFMIAKYMLKDLKKYPALYKVKMDNLNKVSEFAYLITCRRKYILEYFGQTCDYLLCDNCDNCCSNNLVDMTNEWFPIIMDNKKSIAMVSTSLNEYLVSTEYKLNLTNMIMCFRRVMKGKKVVPKEMHIKIPKKLIQVKEIKTLDDELDKYESYKL